MLFSAYIGHCSRNAAGDELFNRIPEEALPPVPCHHNFFLDPGSPLRICRRTVCLQSKDHSFLNGIRVIEGKEPGDDRLLPDAQTYAMAKLQEKGFVFGLQTNG